MIYLVAGICVFNVVMWIVFMIRFDKRFSSENYINKARDDMNALVRSMQKNTVSNIQLVNDTIEELKKTQAAAEKKVELINRKIELLNTEYGMQQFHHSFQNTVQSTQQGMGQGFQTSQNEAGKAVSPSALKARAYVDPNAVYSLNNASRNTSGQQGLFDSFSERNGSTPLKLKDETVVTPTGASYKEVPVISGNFYEEPEVVQNMQKITPKKSVNEQVLYLVQNGLSVSDIASRLNISETEVQFVIDLES